MHNWLVQMRSVGWGPVHSIVWTGVLVLRMLGLSYQQVMLVQSPCEFTSCCPDVGVCSSWW
jgi:hypothetical protein